MQLQRRVEVIERLNVGDVSMTLGTKFKGWLSGKQVRKFSKLHLELNVSAKTELDWCEKLDLTKSRVDLVRVGESSDHIVNGVIMDEFLPDKDVKCKDVDANFLSASKENEKVGHDEDKVKSVLVVEIDGDEEANRDSDSEIEEVDSITFEESISRRKRKAESTTRNCLAGIAMDNPYDLVVGPFPERWKWNSYGNDEPQKKVLLTGETLVEKRNAPSISSAEGLVRQKNQNMHPCIYDDHAGSGSHDKERLKCRKKSLTGETSSQALAGSQSSSAAVKKDSECCIEGAYNGDSSTKNSVLDLPITKYIPIGPGFQAELPEWTGVVLESDRKWLGTQVWPLETPNNKFVIEREPVVQGRPDSCGCRVPKSVVCVKFHMDEERLRVKRELGDAFKKWRFDEMGGEDKQKLDIYEEKEAAVCVSSDSRTLLAKKGVYRTMSKDAKKFGPKTRMQSKKGEAVKWGSESLNK